jgi:hypothetical protein
LQFIVWYHDYRDRFFALPAIQQARSPSPLLSPHPPTPDRYKSTPSSPTTSATEWAISPSSASSWAQWSPLLQTPTPLRDQPFRTETLQIVATFLRPNAKKELSLDADVRDELLRGLERSTHPDIVSPCSWRVFPPLTRTSSCPPIHGYTTSSIRLAYPHS